MTETPVHIASLTKAFAEKQVLEDVSLEVRPGEIFGLIGLNGVGKTTMIKILLGLLNADKGETLLFGHAAASVEARRKFVYLPEKFHPSPLLKGKEFLSFALSYYGSALPSRAAMEHAATTLDLDPAALERRVGKYSKGMGQKLGLLSVLLSDLPLLILDEPMSGLDPKARILLKEQLIAYKAKGHAIFFSSHILADMDEICDRVAVLHDRKIRFTGTPVEMKKRYASESLEKAFLDTIQAAA